MIFRAILILLAFMCSSCDKKRIHNTNLNEFEIRKTKVEIMKTTPTEIPKTVPIIV